MERERARWAWVESGFGLPHHGIGAQLISPTSWLASMRDNQAWVESGFGLPHHVIAPS